MTILGTKAAPRQPRPSPDQPGTLRQQIETIRLWWSIDSYLRAADPEGVWQYCRSRFIPPLDVELVEAADLLRTIDGRAIA